MSDSHTEAKRAAVAAIKLHDRLVKRAKKILKGAPYLVYPSDLDYCEWFRVSIVGDTATLVVHRDSSGYISGEWNEDYEFPASLLFVSDKELTAWQRDQQAAVDEENAAREAHKARIAEARELSQLAALKAKYEKAG